MSSAKNRQKPVGPKSGLHGRKLQLNHFHPGNRELGAEKMAVCALDYSKYLAAEGSSLFAERLKCGTLMSVLSILNPLIAVLLNLPLNLYLALFMVIIQPCNLTDILFHS